MKREGHIYLVIGLIVATLVFLQYNPFFKHSEKFVTEVKQVGEFKHLMVNVNCNIFFVEGEQQGIVYEGPANLVKNIQIDIQKDCISINRKGFTLNNLLFGWMHVKPGKQLNVYVVIRDMNSLEVDDLDGKVLSSNSTAGKAVLFAAMIDHMTFYLHNNNLNQKI
jgi:hypothetical protein